MPPCPRGRLALLRGIAPSRCSEIRGYGRGPDVADRRLPGVIPAFSIIVTHPTENLSMHTFTKLGLEAAALGVLVALVGCSSASDDVESTATSTQALGQRCTVRGNPAVTTGCGDGESCSLVACTSSIPPSCWGTCRVNTPPPVSKSAEPPEGCSGSFACLCGTAACVDGEWTCIGSCGSGTTE